VGAAREEAFREADNLDAVAVGTLQPLDELGQVRLEGIGLDSHLEMSDAHALPPKRDTDDRLPAGRL
jgi:hypothetical protein